MRCPSCRLPLVTAEIAGVELDYCAEELGVWFDEGEIETLLGATAPILPQNREGGRGRRRCPRCDARMRLIYPVPNLELDVCPNGDGIWFDAGEVIDLAEAARDNAALKGARLDLVFAQLQNMLGGTK
jgi:Zn-finger nucleic acid-binding protein